jgi:hypothetical protein
MRTPAPVSGRHRFWQRMLARRRFKRELTRPRVALRLRRRRAEGSTVAAPVPVATAVHRQSFMQVLSPSLALHLHLAWPRWLSTLRTRITSTSVRHARTVPAVARVPGATAPAARVSRDADAPRSTGAHVRASASAAGAVDRIGTRRSIAAIGTPSSSRVRAGRGAAAIEAGDARPEPTSSLSSRLRRSYRRDEAPHVSTGLPPSFAFAPRALLRPRDRGLSPHQAAPRQVTDVADRPARHAVTLAHPREFAETWRPQPRSIVRASGSAAPGRTTIALGRFTHGGVRRRIDAMPESAGRSTPPPRDWADPHHRPVSRVFAEPRASQTASPPAPAPVAHVAPAASARAAHQPAPAVDIVRLSDEVYRQIERRIRIERERRGI